MQTRITFWMALLLLVVTSMRPVQAQVVGGTVAIDTPQDNATLNCTVSVRGTLTPKANWSAVGAYFDVITTNGQITTYNMTRVGNTTQFETNWYTGYYGDTTNTFYIKVRGVFIYGGPPPPNSGAPSTVASAQRTVTVSNGYQIVRDLTKSFAKVISPTEGRVIPVGGLFTVSSSHQLTYERFDDCGTYGVTYSFRNSNTYNGQQNPFYPTTTSKELPKRLGEFVLDTITLTQDYTHTGGAYGDFLVEAFTTVDDPKQRGGMYSSRDAHNFSAARPF